MNHRHRLSPRIFVVGASWNGRSQLQRFIRKGIWELGYDQGDQPVYDERMNEGRYGDVVVVKKMNGAGSDQMTILAIGLLTLNTTTANGRPMWVVDWVLTNMSRPAKLHGCVGSIYLYDRVDARDNLDKKNWLSHISSIW